MQEVLKRLNQFVEQKMSAAGTPGLVVALTDREKLLHLQTYGYANLAERLPVTPDHLFPIGSDGKAFTALAVMQQVEAGRLDLNAPVTAYLPWFRLKSEFAPITLHHLLTHSAGIVAGNDFAPCALPHVYALRETVPGGAPGQRYHYSEIGYKALGLVLEKVTGQSYPELIKKNILDPLNLASTYPAVTHALRPQLAVGYTSMYDDRPYHRSHPLVPAPWVEMDSGDGSIAATAADMAAFLRMWLRRGSPLISEDSFNQMIAPHADMGGGLAYGYGLIVTRKEGFTRLTHGGNTPGYESSWRLDLDNGLGAWVMMNGPLAPGIVDYALRLLRANYLGAEWPALPEATDPAQVENAADYAGEYNGSKRTFRLEAKDKTLTMHYRGERIELEEADEDSFQVNHPAWDKFFLNFTRQEDRVVEANWGPEVFAAPGYAPAETEDYSPEWEAYPGHYRSFSPWVSNFRIILRKGQLYFVESSGYEEVLSPLDSGEKLFRVGEDEQSPEYISFDLVLDNQAHIARMGTGEYYRVSTEYYR